MVGVYLLTDAILGLVLATALLQLAHCVEEAGLPAWQDGRDASTGEWMVHQLETSVDFCARQSASTRYLGGLNLQVVEHHLLLKTRYIHYPAISPIEATCRAHVDP